MDYVLFGSGNISRSYLSAISKIPGARIVACVSRSGASPKNAPDLPSYRSLAQVKQHFDAVIVITPNGLHRQAAVEAAELGKHVLCEKPLDITQEAMDDMISACRSAEVKLAVAYQRRTNPDNINIHHMLESGALGRIYSADLSCKFWRDADYYASADYRGSYNLDGGGPFMQQACHNLDIYRWFFGMPDEIHGVLGNLYHNIEAEDHGAVLFRHGNGMIGSMVASTLARPGLPARLEVVCQKGLFVTEDDRITRWEIDGLPNPHKDSAESVTGAATNSAQLSSSLAHQRIVEDFEAAVAQQRKPLVTGEDARQTTELILEIYKHPVRKSR